MLKDSPVAALERGVIWRVRCAQVESHLSDTDGETGRQHLVSSVVDNYVMYHVITSSQQTWILDDFQQVGLRRYSLL